MIPTSTANAISRTTVYLELSRSAKSSSFFERVLGAVDITPTILSMLASTELRRSADKITSKRTSNKPFYCSENFTTTTATSCRPPRRYAPAVDGSSTRGGSTSVRGRVRVRTSLVAGQLQAASVPIA